MPVHNAHIAKVFNDYADLLEIEAANPFRVRAYRNAAQVVNSQPQAIYDLLKKGADLSELPGIGKDLAGKISEIVRTGELKDLEKIKHRLGGEISELLHIGGLGPNRVKLLHEKLHISTLKALEKAALSGKIKTLRGFSEKTEQRILADLKVKKNKQKRYKLSEADEIARPLVSYLKSYKGVKMVTVAGSYRRRRESVGDLDVLVSAEKGGDVSKYFLKYEDVKKVIAEGGTRSTVILRSGIQVDLRVVPPKSYGAALHYFTGSKAHNIVIRTLGIKKGLKINEYGVFRGDKRIAGKTEEEIFSSVGLPYIEPELRENTGEIEAAKKGKQPKLIELKDIRGDLQMHSQWSDGRCSIKEMAIAAKKKGYDYIAMTDHSQAVAVANGLSAKRLLKQFAEIARINKELKGFTILKSCEVDILEDGTLDLPDSILKEMDVVICSIHSKFNLSQEKQTERIIRAMHNPYFNILGHPTGRLIGVREAYQLDMEKILKAAKKLGCFLEINAHPDRLDLSDIHCRMAKDFGVKLVISTDAHNISDLDFMSYGIGQARRGWVEKNDVINSRSLTELRRMLCRMGN